MSRDAIPSENNDKEYKKLIVQRLKNRLSFVRLFELFESMFRSDDQVSELSMKLEMM